MANKAYILLTDGDLVALYKQTTDMECLGVLYQRYMELVYGVCLKYFKETEASKDAVMQIFEELVHKVLKYDIDNFKPWLYQLAKNHCLMKLRSQKNKPLLVDVEVVHLADNVHLDDVMQKETTLNSMQKCMEQLPTDQKRAIELFYLKEQCYKDIATATQLDISKVRSFIQNGRRNLKICMDKVALQDA